MTELQNNSVQEIWQSQPVEVTKMSVEELRRRAGRFERKIRWRNIREYVASLIAAGLMGYFYITAHDVASRVTFALFIAAMLWIVIALHRMGSARRTPHDVDTLTTQQFYRAELERQLAVVKNVWWWYLAPMVPGMIGCSVSYIMKPHHAATWAGLAFMNALFIVSFYGVWKLNTRAAHCLERMINDLNIATQ
jgi:small-conductance mechanosensitive channel